ncbi:MAG: hypothetical protein U5K69_15520 [Balneolaceae bacterium]|nr:hypothetical protein [Balneolaceae bacterium]
MIRSRPYRLFHIFEHIAFRHALVGTTNWKKEKVALQNLDQAYQKWLAEKYSADPDSAQLDKLWQSFQQQQEEAKQYVVNNEFSQIIDTTVKPD